MQFYGLFLTETNAEISHEQRLGRGNRTMFSMSESVLSVKILRLIREKGVIFIENSKVADLLY